jgi:Protein of unknown function (DUF4031)
MNIQKGAELAQCQIFYRHSCSLRSQRSTLRCQKFGMLILALSRPARRWEPTIPDHFPGAACAVWDALPTRTGGVQMIYVDAIQHYPDCTLHYKRWCHMATDGSLSELHQMAAKLGLRRAWFKTSQRIHTMT